MALAGNDTTGRTLQLILLQHLSDRRYVARLLEGKKQLDPIEAPLPDAGEKRRATFVHARRPNHRIHAIFHNRPLVGGSASRRTVPSSPWCWSPRWILRRRVSDPSPRPRRLAKAPSRASLPPRERRCEKTNRCSQAHRQSPHLRFFKSASEVRALPSPGITRLPRYYDPLRVPAGPPSLARALEQLSTRARVPPLAQTTLPACPAHYPGGSEPVHVSVTSRPVLPSPSFGRVGIHDCTFEACSGFRRVTACRLAWPPQVAFITRLRPGPACRRPRPLVSYQTYRHLSGWDLHPLVICAVGAHRRISAVFRKYSNQKQLRRSFASLRMTDRKRFSAACISAANAPLQSANARAAPHAARHRSGGARRPNARLRRSPPQS